MDGFTERDPYLCVEMDDLIELWNYHPHSPILDFYWGYGHTIQVTVVFGVAPMCIITIGKNTKRRFFQLQEDFFVTGLEELKLFIQECIDEENNHSVYNAFQNFYALAKENNVSNIKADLRHKMATLSCDVPSLGNVYFTILPSERPDMVVITQQDTKKSFKMIPNNVLGMETEFFSTCVRHHQGLMRIRSEPQGDIYDPKSNTSIGEWGLVIEYDAKQKKVGKRRSGRVVDFWMQRDGVTKESHGCRKDCKCVNGCVACAIFE
jgi:hypothetical protein